MKIFCIGRNYREHALELNNEVPESPVVFMKPNTALIGNQGEMYYPNFTHELHHEVELVIQLGKGGRSVHEKHALSYIRSITVGIDFTARDLQQTLKSKGLPWELAKGFDQSALVGPWYPFNPNYQEKPIHFSLKKNDHVVQQGSTDNLLFRFEKLISFISTYFTLQTGDLIFTGTPAGVGPVSIGDCLQGYLEQEQVFTLRIC